MIAHLRQSVARDFHGIRAHVGDERDGTFLAQFDAFVQFLRERHGALGGEAQAIVAGLLKLRSGEGRRSEAALFLLRDARSAPNSVAHVGQDALRFGFVRDFDVLALVLEELGFKRGRLARTQERVDSPIFLGDECTDFLLALDDQAQGHGLHAAGGQAAANLVPEQRRNFVTHDAIQHAASLLRVHQMRVHFLGMLEGGLDGLLRDFVEHHAVDGRHGELGLGDFYFFLWRVPVFRCVGVLFGLEIGVRARVAEDFFEMRADGFAFAIRVAREIDGVGALGRFAQLVDNFDFSGNDLVLGLEDVCRSNHNRFGGLLLRSGFRALALGLGLALLLFAFAVLFAGQKDAYRFPRQVHDVAVGGLHGVVAAEILIDSFRLGRRFDNYQRASHAVLVSLVKQSIMNFGSRRATPAHSHPSLLSPGRLQQDFQELLTRQLAYHAFELQVK